MLPLVQQMFPPLSSTLRKGDCGRIAVVGGSFVYSGAPYFSAITSLKTGADLVHVFCPAEAATVIKGYSPELMVHPSYDLNTLQESMHRIDAFILGPGLGRNDSTLSVVQNVIEISKERSLPLIIDADGLYLLASKLDLINRYSKAILTPNYPEFTRLYSMAFNVEAVDDEKRRSGEAARELAQHLGITIFQKGIVDIITDGTKIHFGRNEGSPRRCGGQGDVLNGVLAVFALWASKMNYSIPMVSAGLAASEFIRAAAQQGFKKYGRSMLATNIIDEIPDLIKQLDKIEL